MSDGQKAEPTSVEVGSSGGGSAWYHADFCHAYAWVYEQGDHLRVRWAERERENLYLHAREDCWRCEELARNRHRARNGEFTMPKPDAKFSSTEAFLTVLAEIAEYVPGLLDETTSDRNAVASENEGW